MTFGWMHMAYKVVQLNCNGLPLGNGSYIPYDEQELNMLNVKYCLSYVIRRLIRFQMDKHLWSDVQEDDGDSSTVDAGDGDGRSGILSSQDPVPVSSR
jgi:hypothetical protein